MDATSSFSVFKYNIVITEGDIIENLKDVFYVK